jgi:hypothetical protein
MDYNHQPNDTDTHRSEADLLQEAASCGSGALAAIAPIFFALTETTSHECFFE